MAEYIEKDAFIRSIEGNPFTTESVKSYIRVSVKKFPAADVRENTIRTQADRIRAMSDEELAEFIGGIYTLERDAWGEYDPCVVVEQSVKIRDKDDMLNWLRSPAGGEK